MVDSLLRGNRRFIHKFEEEQELFDSLKTGQCPGTVWIGCSDSRVDPALITDCGAGEVFVHRNVGNIVAPDDVGLCAALQYAVVELGAPHIVVCGHYGCGGMAALTSPPEHLKHVTRWVERAAVARERALAEVGGNAHDEKLLADLTVEHNVRLAIENLLKLPFVAEAADSGKTTLHGWVYDIGSGKITVLEYYPA